MSCAIVQLYIEGYLQAMLDVMYKQEYLRVRVIDDQVTSSYLFSFLSVISCMVSPRTSVFFSLCERACIEILWLSEQSDSTLGLFQVILKNLPPNSALINEIVDNVKSFLVSKALLKGDSSTVRPLRHLRNEPVSSVFALKPCVGTLTKVLPVVRVIDLITASRNGGLRRRCSPCASTFL